MTKTRYVTIYDGLEDTAKEIRAKMRAQINTDNPEELARQLAEIECYTGSLSELLASWERVYREKREQILLDLKPQGLRAAEQEIIIDARTATFREKRDFIESLQKAVYTRINSIQSLLAYKRDELRVIN